jgi:hypothetical protein
MTDHHDQLDEWLQSDAGATDIVPSSGFTDRVMTAVRESAVAPPPIPFPWLRVVPWIVVAIALMGFSSLELTRLSPAASPEVDWPGAWQNRLQSIASPDMAWLTLGILLSLVTMTFALRVGAWRRPR